MIYARFSVPERLLEAGERAEVLYQRSVEYVALEGREDGFISDAEISRIAEGMDDVRSRVRQLARTGLWQWDESRGGYTVHGWVPTAPQQAHPDPEHQARAHGANLALAPSITEEDVRDELAQKFPEHVGAGIEAWRATRGEESGDSDPADETSTPADAGPTP